MQHKLAEKIAALAFLKENGNNVSRTARSLGIDRRTLNKWKKQLGENPKTRTIVERATEDLAALEEANARLAIEELANRLQDNPEKLKVNDLINLKDSSIKNARLLTDRSTENLAIDTRVRITADEAPLLFARMLIQREPSLTTRDVEMLLFRAAEPDGALEGVTDDQIMAAVHVVRDIRGG